MPLKRSTFLLTFLKFSSIFSCLSAAASAAFFGFGPGLDLGAFGSLGALGSLGAFGGLGSLGVFGGFGSLGTFGGLGSLGWADLPLFLAAATEKKPQLGQERLHNTPKHRGSTNILYKPAIHFTGFAASSFTAASGFNMLSRGPGGVGPSGRWK